MWLFLLPSFVIWNFLYSNPFLHLLNLIPFTVSSKSFSPVSSLPKTLDQRRDQLSHLCSHLLAISRFHWTFPTFRRRPQMSIDAFNCRASHPIPSHIFPHSSSQTTLIWPDKKHLSPRLIPKLMILHNWLIFAEYGNQTYRQNSGFPKCPAICLNLH